ncbi:Protein transport protein yip1 [Saitozyma sp. JCM 24511]|nr:Protein transport protein yip1 [Saitozyma sp. JCM 24511]
MSSHLFQNSYPQAQPYGSEPLAFFGSNPSGSSTSPYYPASRTSLEGNVGGGPSSYASGSMGSMGNMGNMGNMGSMGSMSGARLGGVMASEGRWWEAFGTGGFEGEPSLMEELGINPGHILQKSLTVLNPLSKVNAHIMDDADLAGPFVFCFAFAFVLLLSGKPQFSYIYGVGLLGTTAIYLLLNLMSDSGIDAYRTASVLGYCLLPMVGLGGIGMAVGIDHPIGYALAAVSIVWCTHSASAIFVACLRMDHQRLLVAYPVGLLYGCFALLSIFNVKK